MVSEETETKSVACAPISCVGLVLFIVFVVVMWHITPELVSWLEWKLNQR